MLLVVRGLSTPTRSTIDSDHAVGVDPASSLTLKMPISPAWASAKKRSVQFARLALVLVHTTENLARVGVIVKVDSGRSSGKRSARNTRDVPLLKNASNDKQYAQPEANAIAGLDAAT